MTFDLLLKGGRVVDPATGRDDVLDIGVARGRIAAIAPGLPSDAAAHVVDVTGRVVTPGLIDYHAHAFRAVTFWGVDAESVGARTGVTTWVDAGSAGAYTIDGFREFIAEPAKVRVYAFLNISAIGLVGHNYELANPAFADPELCTQLARRHADLVVGVKARMGTPTVGSTGVEGLRMAKQAARYLGMPVMVHIATGPPTIEEVVTLLDEGDVLTHVYTPQDMGIAGSDGRPLDAVAHAIERGVVLDVGHGSGSFAFRVAEPLLDAGVLPDVISTDIHQLSIDGPMFDLPTTLSKFMALGLSLSEVIERATNRPAALLGLEGWLGTLAPGAAADIAVFDLQTGSFPFYDIDQTVRHGSQLLVNELTIVAGRPLPRGAEHMPAPWMEHDFSREENFYINTALKELLLERGHVPAVMARQEGGLE